MDRNTPNCIAVGAAIVLITAAAVLVPYGLWKHYAGKQAQEIKNSYNEYQERRKQGLETLERIKSEGLTEKVSDTNLL